MYATIKKRRLSQRGRQEQRTAYLCLIPAFVGLIFLTYLPLVAVFGISFFNWKGLSTPTFCGIENYIRLFTTDPYFKESIKVTVVFSILSVFGGMIYSLVVAMLLNRKIPARGFFRALFYLPYVLPAAAVYIGWSWLYETNFGLFNYILKSIGIDNVLFLNDSKYVIPSLALISVWLSGNLIVIFLSGLQNVPRVYHEAAEIDGANGFQRFLHVTLELRDAFRKEFGKSLGLGVLFGGLLAGSYYLLSLGRSNGGNPYGLLFSGGGLCLLAIAVLWGQYSFVLLPSLDLPLGAILRNGWSLAFLGEPSSLGVLVLEAAGVLFLVMLSPISLGIALFFGVAFVQYTICFLVNFPLQKWILEPFRRSQQEGKP